MKDFNGKIAVVTGGGTGMGRELVRQLSAEGCHVAMCDVSAEEMERTQKQALEEAPRARGSPPAWRTFPTRRRCWPFAITSPLSIRPST